MKNRLGLAAAFLLASASFLQAQQNMFKLEGAKGAVMISLNEPVLIGGMYVFNAWPDGGKTNVPQAKVKKITRLTGAANSTIYQLNLLPSGIMTARDKPRVQNGMYVFHDWQLGTLMSVRQTDVRSVTPMTGDKAFWIEQGLKGATKNGDLSMDGTGNIVMIGTPQAQPNSSQAGPQNLNTVSGQSGTSGINGAPVGNWQYQGTPGTSDAYGPANATMDNGVPTMPAATNGGAPPTQQPPQ